MKFHIVDILIIFACILPTIFIGLYIRKRAAKNLDSYFWGNEGMPWYVLGVSNALGSVIGFLAYAFQGIGEFATTLLPWTFGTPQTTSQVYAIIFIVVTAIYVVTGETLLLKTPGAGHWAVVVMNK